LSVIDNGAGIDPEFAPHVFELYRQANQSARHLPGLGIGLAIVSQIVKHHGGTARVESAGLGHGSTFVVTLPLMPAIDGDASAPRIGRRSGKTRRSKSEEPS
jgi:signal transduction histidine kinase